MFARCVPASLALVLLGGAACAKPAEQTAAAPPAVDSAAVKAAVSDVWARWIVADTAGNVEALMALVGDSARFDARGMPPIVGRANLRAAVEPIFKSTKYTAMAITPEMTEVLSDALAYETGNYVETYVVNKKSMTDYGRYAAAVGKDADGQWRVMYMMAFADSTVPAKP